MDIEVGKCGGMAPAAHRPAWWSVAATAALTTTLVGSFGTAQAEPLRCTAYKEALSNFAAETNGTFPVPTFEPFEGYGNVEVVTNYPHIDIAVQCDDNNNVMSINGVLMTAEINATGHWLAWAAATISAIPNTDIPDSTAPFLVSVQVTKAVMDSFSKSMVGDYLITVAASTGAVQMEVEHQP